MRDRDVTTHFAPNRARPIVLALVTSLLQAGSARADLAEGLVAHWKLDETAGDAVADSAGPHNGTNHGAALGSDGFQEKAALFDKAEDDFIDVGEGLQLNGTNQVTVSAFVCPESFNPPDGTNRANSRNGILGDSDTRFIFALTDGGRPVFVWDAGDRKFQTIVTDAGDGVPRGVWSHVAVTRNGSTMILYVNGELKKWKSDGSAVNFVPFGRTHLGRVNGSSARDFDGRIDDVRVYSRQLSITEIWELAQLDKLPRRPFGRGRLDRMKHNNPGLVVDLGVGLWAWPLPMDYDRDGDLDLLVSCHDVPYNGTYFFENPGGGKLPVFKPGRLVFGGIRNVPVAHARPRVCRRIGKGCP
ncbi:MAG: LamG domain-containing protein [Planctomycetota bacterium]